MIDNIECFVEVSGRSFRNRAADAANRSIELIQRGDYAAAMVLLADAVRYDGIAVEYEFIREAVEE